GFRVEAAKQLGIEPVDVVPGPIEMTQRQLRDRIEVLQLTPGGGRAARRFEDTYHMKLALAANAIPLGLIAIAVALSRRGRARPTLSGACCVVACLAAVFVLDALAERLLMTSPPLPPAAFAWAPTLVAAALAATISRAALRPAQ